MKTKMRCLMFFLVIIVLSGCTSQSMTVRTGETAIDKEKEKIRLSEWYAVSKYNMNNKINGHVAFLNRMTKKEGELLLEKSKVEKDIQEKYARIEDQRQKISKIDSELAKMNIADGVINEKIDNAKKKLKTLVSDSDKLSTKPSFTDGKLINLSDVDSFRKISWKVTMEDDQNYFDNEFNSDTTTSFEREVKKLDLSNEDSVRALEITTKGEVVVNDDKNTGAVQEKQKKSGIAHKNTSYQNYTLAVLDGWKNKEKAEGVGDFLTSIGCKVDRVGITNYIYSKLINNVLVYCKRTKNNQVVVLLKKGFSPHKVIVKKAFKSQKEDVVVVIGRNVLK